MNTVDLLEQALAVAGRLGYRIRQEWLDGAGGACVLAGQKWLFIDLSLDTAEQLQLVLDALSDDAALAGADLPPDLAVRLERRKAA